ncbi:hypothetical protein AAE02nite_27640 [Adhaeribacter aerolatus]|uniref:DUF4403 domain-containing protein n=1 Tax=Adhaeribacter aerolatus TaxID=670289 RepID=A0A512AZH6_9BACT|nr:DUF4403 family protein [Adhaeribacter aerolatus]GEO05100.1 hypothetical protein AAE02nite_27640 [Adhaeribacter aerolatus]
MNILKRNIIRVFYCWLILFLVSCTQSSQLNPQAPTQEVTAPAPAVFAPKLSTITIPVSFRISTLEEKLNQQITGILYKDDNLEDDNLKVTVVKAGNLALQANGDKIYITIPLHVSATGRWRWEACKSCPRLEKTESTNFDLVVKSESQLSLTEDYQVKSTSISDFEWGSTKPVLTLGPLKIGLARFIEPSLRSQMQTLAGQLDREVQNRLKIKDYVQQAWAQVQQPIPLNKDLDAWLTIMPQAIKVSPLMANNGNFNLQIGLSSYLQTITNGKPKVQLNPILPPLVTDNHLVNNVQIGLMGEISYDHATKILKQQLTGKQFSFSDGRDQLTVHDVALSGSGDKLVVMLNVTGQTKKGFFTKNMAGKIFLKAVPYLDAETNSIRVRDVDYDLDTKDQLLKAANWLAKNRFTQTIESQLSLPFKSQLAEGHKLLQQNLDHAAGLNESIKLTGQITELVPDAIYLTPTSIKAVVNAKGNLSAQIVGF